MADNVAAPVQNAGAYKRTVPGNIDWYYGGGDIAWTDKAAAIAGVPIWRRSGQTVAVFSNSKIVEYIWHPSDLSDAGLVLKFDVLSSAGGTIRGQVYLNNGTKSSPKWSADPNTGDRHDQFAEGTGEEDNLYIFEWLNDLNDGNGWLFRKNDNGRFQDIFKIMQNGLQHKGKTVPIGTGTNLQFIDGTGTIRNLTDLSNYVVLTYNATNNTYSGTLTPAITGYTVGQPVIVRVQNANNGLNTQITLNGLGSVQIYKNNGTSLAAGDLQPGIYTLVYGPNAAFYLQGSTVQAATFAAITGQPADNPNLKIALDGKVNATGPNTAMASTEDGRVSFLDRTGQLLQSTWLKFVNATRELTIGDAANPGKLTVFSNVFKLQVQDNIGDGQASIVINALQDKAFQIVDKLGNVYMIFRTLASGAGVVISKLWIFDQNVGSPLYRAQAAVTSNGAGTKVYATKGDAANTAYSIDMNVDTQVCGLNFRLKVYDVTGNKIIHAKWEGTLKRIGGVISVTGTPESKTLCDNGTSGFAFGVEPKADNTGLLLYFTPGAGDTTPYTGSFYDINYSF